MQMGNPFMGLPIFRISAIYIIPAKWNDITIGIDTEFVFYEGENI